MSIGVHQSRAKLFGLAALGVLWLATAGRSQENDIPISTSDSSVGYIDQALPQTQIRERFEAGYDIDKSNRGEFLWAWPAPVGPGPAQREVSTDYQSFTTYLEVAPTPCFSLFAELPLTIVNPVVNDNTSGLDDIRAGFKYAFCQCEQQTLTFQFRVYSPTGDEDRGIGVGHFSLEPGLLAYRRLGDCWILEGELRYWTPVDGTEDRAGDLVRYGLGISHAGLCFGGQRVRPVFEAVGWTMLDGLTTFATVPAGPIITEDAAGDTILNLKFGARLDVGCLSDVYVGYGRAVTDQRWYEDVLRVEWRQRF